MLTVLVFFYVYITNQPIINDISRTETIVIIDKDVKIKYYFDYIDSIIDKHSKRSTSKLSEHVLVRYNPWILNKLSNTDYYRLMEQDSFVYDQKELIVLEKGLELYIPDSIKIDSILKTFENTIIDINIPEYKLRIFIDSLLQKEFLVRVGRNENRYLEFGNRITDLRTQTGSGTIVAHVCNPDYYNPENGHQYFVTKRDDERITGLPQIPFLETEINGIRNGQLIHPTTNRQTLGKPCSNGCIGTSEGDAWIIYYYAPVGTKIDIRYDLKVKDSLGNETILKDIYGLSDF